MKNRRETVRLSCFFITQPHYLIQLASVLLRFIEKAEKNGKRKQPAHATNGLLRFKF